MIWHLCLVSIICSYFHLMVISANSARNSKRLFAVSKFSFMSTWKSHWVSQGVFTLVRLLPECQSIVAPSPLSPRQSAFTLVMSQCSSTLAYVHYLVWQYTQRRSERCNIVISTHCSSHSSPLPCFGTVAFTADLNLNQVQLKHTWDHPLKQTQAWIEDGTLVFTLIKQTGLQLPVPNVKAPFNNMRKLFTCFKCWRRKLSWGSG